ncbi:MAG: SDR family oxidoreductase [bacterium]|nr:SDR family oxidoreductase [bacterium]
MMGKVVLVTGGTSGIGKETARELARMGATTVLVGRNPEKTAAVVREIQDDTGNRQVTALLGDLSLQRDVRRVADAFKAAHDRLDVLINNAGTIFFARKVTAEGIEATWALNHLAYFLLTECLLDVLQKSAPSRIVNVASKGHMGGSIHFDDLMAERSYDGRSRYNDTKLANVLFTRELARRLTGTGVTVNALHPGTIPSSWNRDGQPVPKWLVTVLRPFTSTAQQGAQTTLYLATSPKVEGVSGAYFAHSKPITPSAKAMDDAAAQRLWAVSESQIIAGDVVGA